MEIGDHLLRFLPQFIYDLFLFIWRMLAGRSPDHLVYQKAYAPNEEEPDEKEDAYYPTRNSACLMYLPIYKLRIRCYLSSVASLPNALLSNVLVA